MPITMNLHVDARSPIPIRRQLTEQLKHAIESGGVPRDQTLPSIRELAGFLGINTNTVARVIEDLKQSGYVEARREGRVRGPGAARPPLPSPPQRLSTGYGDAGGGPRDDRRRPGGRRAERGQRSACGCPGD